MSDAPPDPPKPDASPPRFDWPDTPQRIAFLTGLVAFGMLGGMLLSYRLWLSDRSYPLVPVWDLLPPVPYPLDAVWYGAMLLLLLAVAAVPRPRWLLVPFLVLAGASALWDQSRWQPWFYQYLALLLALTWAAWNPGRLQTQEAALDTCRLIVAATYFWSGVQKMNAAFVEQEFPWLLSPLLSVLPESLQALAGRSGFVAPFIESAIGVGLLFRPTRLLAVVGAVVMHLALLLLLSPFGHNWNTVVWPWNIVLALTAVILFWRTSAVTARSILWPREFLYSRVVLLLFGILPGLHLFGLWDAYLSAALYSGNTLEGYIQIEPDQHEHLSEDVREYLYPVDDHWRLDLSLWSLREMNVPAYPARRVYRRVAAALAARTDPPAEVTLLIRERPNWYGVERRVTVERYGRRGVTP